MADTRPLEISCLVSSIEQLDAVIQNRYVRTVYVGWQMLSQGIIKDIAAKVHGSGKRFYIALPHVCRKSTIEFFDKNRWLFECAADGYLIRNIEEYFYIKNMPCRTVFDYSVYSFNRRAERILSGFQNCSTTAPLELNYKELRDRGCGESEIVIYGFVPVMISAGCIKKTTGACNHISEDIYLRDRTGSSFLCRSVCRLCYNIIYNSRPLSLLKKYDEVSVLGPRSVRLEFICEDGKQTADITNRFVKQYIDNVTQTELSYFTRGHFTRGVK